MTTKKKTTRKKKSAARRGRYAWLHDEILSNLIAPKIVAGLRAGVSSKVALMKYLEAEYGCTASDAVLSQWLRELGYETRRETRLVPTRPLPTSVPTTEDNFNDPIDPIDPGRLDEDEAIKVVDPETFDAVAALAAERPQEPVAQKGTGAGGPKGPRPLGMRAGVGGIIPS